jgi:hypothetical protein
MIRMFGQVNLLPPKSGTSNDNLRHNALGVHNYVIGGSTSLVHLHLHLPIRAILVLVLLEVWN